MTRHLPAPISTRERVPALGWGVGAKSGGIIDYADVGASIAMRMACPVPPPGATGCNGFCLACLIC